MAYDVGQRVRVDFTIADADGALANTTLTINVTRGDFTAYPAPAAVNDGTGLYHFYVDVDVPGPWVWQASGTTPIKAARSGQFFVRSTGARLVSLTEAKKQLNKDLIITTDDDEVLDLVDTSTTLIEEIVGAVVPRTVIEVHSGGGRSIVLRQRARSITSVVEAVSMGFTTTLVPYVVGVNAPVDGYLYVIAKNALHRTSGESRMHFQGGPNAITVTYVAGRLAVPPNFRTAALELITHVWRTSQYARGSTRPRVEGDNTTIVMGYAIPNRVLELLGRRKRAPRLGTGR